MIKTLTTIKTTRGSIITIKVAFFAINPLKLHKYYFESRLLNWVTGREMVIFHHNQSINIYSSNNNSSNNNSTKYTTLSIQKKRFNQLR